MGSRQADSKERFQGSALAMDSRTLGMKRLAKVVQHVYQEAVVPNLKIVMNNSNLSDIEIENLLFGKWRFDTRWEKISIEFKDDMTYEQTRIQTFILDKPGEFITGNKFSGIWHVTERKLCLNVKTVPKSLFNFHIPLLSRVSLADMAARFGSVFITEKYEVIKIDISKFLMMDGDESIIGTKINYKADSSD